MVPLLLWVLAPSSDYSSRKFKNWTAYVKFHASRHRRLPSSTRFPLLLDVIGVHRVRGGHSPCDDVIFDPCSTRDNAELKKVINCIFCQKCRQLYPLCAVVATSTRILDYQRGQGGASRRVGGRDERPPQYSRSPNSASPKPVNKLRWVPPSNPAKKDSLTALDDRNDAIFRRVRGILNKLTPDKFDKLSLELLNVGIESRLILKGIILLIFEKALDEPKYSSLYAQLCHRLCEDAPNFEPPDSNITTFRRLLLNKCQDEFENRSRAREDFDKRDGPFSDEEQEQYHIAKKKMLGNIKFIGELGKLEMLHEGILHKCIKQLLEKKRRSVVQDRAEDLECLCQIMRTVGRRLDTNKAKSWMDQYFARIQSFALNPDMPARNRFMLQDIVDLRRNKWVPRRITVDNLPRTIQQIREEAARDYGVYFPPPASHGPVRGSMNLFGRTNGMPGSTQRGGMGILDSFAPGMMDTAGMGTGPGVITLDGFNSTFENNNMGRNRNQGFFPNYGNKRQEGSGNNTDRERGDRERGNYQQQNRGNYRGRGGQQNQSENRSPGQYNNHSPQAGQYSNNQNQDFDQQNSNNQSQQKPNRDLPPRFMKKSGSGEGEISLRPAKNFMMFKPGTPSMLPMSAQVQNNSQTPPLAPLPNQQAEESGPPINPLMPKQPQITIKQAVVHAEKNKANKKQVPTKDEALKLLDELLVTYLEENDAETAAQTIREWRVPKKYFPELVSALMIKTIDQTDSDRAAVSKLVSRMKSENVIYSEHFMEAFNNLLSQMSELEIDVPLVRSYVAKYAARSVIDEIITLTDLAEPMENGTYYPLFMLCLQQMFKMNGKDWLYKQYTESKVNLQNMLPESDRTKEKMMEILEERGLSFLFPMLRIQNDLWRQIQKDPNAGNLYKWIKENADQSLHTDKGFIHILATNLLRYITKESTIGEGVDPNATPDKNLLEKEKELITRFKGVLQMFLHDHTQLQVSVLYALQVHCHSNGFPKGMLLRFFMHFYDLEVVEEEAFFKWKEEINDEFPGKGKALFQVNQWLMWLEQAEEETDDDDN